MFARGGHRAVLLVAAVLGAGVSVSITQKPAAAQEPPPAIFVKTYCVSCHSGQAPGGRLSLAVWVTQIEE